MANFSMRQASADQRRHRMSALLSNSRPTLGFESLGGRGRDGGTAESLLSGGRDTLKISDMQGLKDLLFDRVNILCVFVPLGWYSHFAGWDNGSVFALNFMALIPLAKILGDATEELAAGLKNDTLGGLLNATFGNAVEMILTLQTLNQGLITVVKGALLGSILSNLLLVLGMSFFFGGIGHKGKEQEFKETGPMANISMLLLACASFTMPTAFHFTLSNNPHVSPEQALEVILKISRVASIFILSCYIAFLLFQLWTHITVFEEEGEEGDDATISVPASLSLLLVSTLMTAVNSEFLVGSIEGVVYEWGISASFIGVILLPIVGNACEHASAIRMCIQDKPVIAIGIAVGSCTQIALFVVPFAVLVGWWLGQPMDLDFGVLDVCILVLSVIIGMSILVDGKSNWLEGYMLQLTYFIVAVVYWYDPSGDAGKLKKEFVGS